MGALAFYHQAWLHCGMANVGNVFDFKAAISVSRRLEAK